MSATPGIPPEPYRSALNEGIIDLNLAVAIGHNLPNLTSPFAPLGDIRRDTSRAQAGGPMTDLVRHNLEPNWPTTHEPEGHNARCATSCWVRARVYADMWRRLKREHT